jgi:flagellar biosynthesis regulator FlbT
MIVWGKSPYLKRFSTHARKSLKLESPLIRRTIQSLLVVVKNTQNWSTIGEIDDSIFKSKEQSQNMAQRGLRSIEKKIYGVNSYEVSDGIYILV